MGIKYCLTTSFFHRELCLEVLYTLSNRHQCSFFTQNSPLSNMYPSPFVLDGVQYTCSKQFIVVSKATLFDDSKTALAVMHEKDPKVMKSLGKDIVGLHIEMWYAKAPELIFPGLMAKYEQNPLCREFLLATAEASPNKQWGTGFTLHSPNLVRKFSTPRAIATNVPSSHRTPLPLSNMYPKPFCP